MKEFVTKLEGQFDRYMIRFSSKIGVPFLRYAIGIIFIWFGALKMIGELSPAYDLVAATIYWLTPEIIVPLLGLWEIAIGVAFLIPALTRVGIVLLAFQMPGTFLTLVLLPEICFTVIPFGLTLEGQYIVKNLVIIGSALVIVAGLSTKKSDKLLGSVSEEKVSVNN
jgi:uncharacterized membrane protein YphA (DoxX/SURF4 family)